MVSERLAMQNMEGKKMARVARHGADNGVSNIVRFDRSAERRDELLESCSYTRLLPIILLYRVSDKLGLK
jgi:hypothetical protein